MNIQRGLFRLWLVFSVLFIIATASFSFNDIYKNFENAYFFKPRKSLIPLLPADCTKARGQQGIDYKKDQREDFQSDITLCWYELHKFRAVFPEYDSVKDQKLVDAAYHKFLPDRERSRPWKALFNSVCIALGIPTAIFAFGWALLWALSGFSSKKPTQ